MLAEMITSGSSAAQVPELAVAQLHRELGLQQRVGAGRAAAQVRFVQRHAHVEAELVQMRLDPAAQLLAVLQGAGRMECEARPLLDNSFGRSVGTMSGSSSERSRVRSADAARLLGIGRIVAQQSGHIP